MRDAWWNLTWDRISGQGVFIFHFLLSNRPRTSYSYAFISYRIMTSTKHSYHIAQKHAYTQFVKVQCFPIHTAILSTNLLKLRSTGNVCLSSISKQRFQKVLLKLFAISVKTVSSNCLKKVSKTCLLMHFLLMQMFERTKFINQISCIFMFLRSSSGQKT